MHHYSVYEMQALLTENVIVLLSSSPQINLHRLRMKLREDREVYYIFKDHNCARIHQFLNETYCARMQGDAPGHKVIVVFDMESKPFICSVIEYELLDSYY